VPQVKRLLNKVMQLNREQCRYLIRAVWYLARARLAFSLQNAQAIVSNLAGRNLASNTRSASSTHATAKQPDGSLRHGFRQGSRHVDPRLVGWSIQGAARRVPWRSDCLIQAMAAAQWLRRHGLKPAFHLGVAKADEGDLTAHAWLSLHGEVIVGGAESAIEHFVPILTPAHEIRRHLRATGVDEAPTDG